MNAALRAGLLSFVFCAAQAQAAFTTQPLTDAEAQLWTRHLVPLPKQISLAGKFSVPAGQLVFAAEKATEPLVKQAIRELNEAARITSDATPTGEPFRVVLQAGGPAAAVFKNLRHPDQAYTIRPAEAGDGLVLVGGGPRGLYYAAKTLQQFILARRSEGGPIEIPAVTITDWPDLEDRGFWGGDSYDYLRWMSDRKLNYDEQIAGNDVDVTGKPRVNMPPGKQKIIDEGPTYGINPVPVVLHLEQLSGTGLFEAYPQLKGKDGREGTICYSNPLFVNILSQWLFRWASKPGVREIDVWMAENLNNAKGCQCEQCRTEDRSVLEVKAIVAAREKVRRVKPGVDVRTLTSEETEKANPQVFAAMPPDMKVWYYHSLFTYNSSEKPMIADYLVKEIEKGRWLGVCPNVCANVGCWQPFTGAQFMHYRMNEFADKKLSGYIGYAVPGIAYVRFNAEAAAEWAWNAKGRSPREFALSYAVRQGHKNPELFADWADLHGPVAWDVYGSDFPAGHARDFPGKLADLLKKGKVPAFGEVLWEVYPLPWGDIPSADALAVNVKNAERSVELARQMGIPEYLNESRVTEGYMHALDNLWKLKQLVKDGAVSETDRDAARAAFTGYLAGLEQASAALVEWEVSVPGGRGTEHWVKKPRGLLAEMITQMKTAAADLGCAVE